MSEICSSCGQVITDTAPTHQVKVKIDVSVGHNGVLTRGHVHQIVSKIIDDWYVENNYEPMRSGTVIDTVVAQQDQNAVTYERR